MLQILVPIAIAVGSAGVRMAPRVIQGVDTASKRLRATVTPKNVDSGLQAFSGVQKLVAGTVPVITGLSISTTSGCSGGGGDGGGTVPPGDGGGGNPSCDCTASLAWDANTEADLAGYVVQWGTSPGNYTDEWFTTNPSAMISNLEMGRTHYFVVRAYDTAGNRSDPSNEVSKTAQ